MSPLVDCMQALVFDGPARDESTSRVATVPVPLPGPGEVSIRVHQAGVNFKDVMSRRGDPGYVPAWPFTPGLEVAGVVLALGEGVTGVRPGDRVAAYTGAGGLAEVAVAKAELTALVPDGLDLRRAATAPGVLVTAALLVGHFGRVQPGDVVLVHGAAGGVGQAVARIARHAGAGVLIGVVGSPGRVVAALRSGYDAVLPEGPDLAAALRRAADGRAVDVILDPRGTARLELDLQVVGPGARIVLFGNAAGESLAALPPVARLFAGNLSIAGFSLAALVASAPGRVATALDQALGQLAAGMLDLEVTTVAGLDRASAAQQALAEGRGHGKQVVELISEH